MAEWLPAIKQLLASRGILPQPYPYFMRTILGSAVATLCALLFLSVGFGIYKVGQGVLWVSSSVQSGFSSLVEPSAEPPVPVDSLSGNGAKEASKGLNKSAKELKEATAASSNQTANQPSASEVASGTQAMASGTGSLAPSQLGQVLRAKLQNNPLPYPESSHETTDIIKKIDFALVQTLIRQGVDENHLYFLGSEYREHEGERYLFQRLKIWLPQNHDFVQNLQDTLGAWSDGASITLTSLGAGSLKISIQQENLATHDLWVVSVGSEFMLPPVPSLNEQAKITIVIDDLGENVSAAQALLGLNFPVTFSIWPRSNHAQQVAQLAKAAGREVLIHQPMEATQSPYVQTGPGNLNLAMSVEEVEKTLATNIQLLPQADGLNNHMGSRYTKSPKAMEQLVKILSKHGLFALDSLTHPDSVFYNTSRQQGLPAYKRAIFLDDGRPSTATVLAELNKLEKLALSQGQAIAIGHPHPETLAALKEWSAKKNPQLVFVPLRYLDLGIETLNDNISVE